MTDIAATEAAAVGALPALITGASGGIGADLARVFARNGHPVALVARSADKLHQLAEELRRDHGVRVVVAGADLAKPGAAQALVQDLTAQGFRPGILVNNAGYGLIDTFEEQDQADQLGIIDLNCRALTEITRTFLPQIVAARGKILNVASIAGFYPGPGAAVYYASKAYVLSFGRALHHELRHKGVTVTSLCPGPTRSNFFARAGFPRMGLRSMMLMESMPVAEAGYRATMVGRKQVAPGLQNWLLVSLAGVTPHFLSLRIIEFAQKQTAK